MKLSDNYVNAIEYKKIISNIQKINAIKEGAVVIENSGTTS